jgi:glutathione synthase/RimK-type ligase-like ATP-grasp enzyme
MDYMFIYGIPDDQTGKVLVDAKGGISIQLSGSANVRPFLKLPGKAHPFHLQSGTSQQAFKINYWPSVIFNEISDPDSHTTSLKRCEAFCDMQKVTVINRPEAILQTRRDIISENLKNQPGLIMPLTVRFNPETPEDVGQGIAQAGLQYPVIFRQAGDHGGISTVLLNSEADINAAMYAFALDGRAYYLTEFRDYASPDGLYRKYRVVVVEGKPYLRHMIVSSHWLIHSSSREFMKAQPQYAEEEASVLATFDEKLRPLLSPLTQTLAEKLQLEYFGIDCNVTADNRLLIFEINANMNILTNNQAKPNIWEKPISAIISHVEKMVLGKAQSQNRPKSQPAANPGANA